jgi:hypothetical protein
MPTKEFLKKQHEERLKEFEVDFEKMREKAADLKNPYPKLLAIGWTIMRDSPDGGTLVYLLEDENLFYGYAQNPDFWLRVKAGQADIVALRWCQGLVLPKGNEDVRKLYLEALDIIKNDKTGRLVSEYLSQKKYSEEDGKEYALDLEEMQKRTLADPTLLKYFL